MNHETDGNKHTFFYDTYALYAIARGWPTYATYASSHRIVTTLLNLYELYYTLLKECDRNLAEEFFQRIMPFCTAIRHETIKKAAQFRLENIKRKLSYIDCLGYTIAKEHHIPFLTGDKGFQDIPGVEYVK